MDDQIDYAHQRIEETNKKIHEFKMDLMEKIVPPENILMIQVKELRSQLQSLLEPYKGKDLKE